MRRLTIDSAQVSSSAADGRPAGEDAGAARRVGHAGDLGRPHHAEVAQVRQHGDAEADADVGQRVLERREQVVDRAFDVLDEGRRHALRARLHVNRRRGDLQRVAGVGLAHPRVERQQRHALAVDRDLDLLGEVQHRHRGAADEPAERLVVQHHLERVVAVGRERVHHRDAAARADGRAFHLAHLRGGAADLVGDRGGAGVAVAGGEAADLAGRAQVAVHQGRRERLHVGDVVEAGADGVGRQVGGDVDVEVQQVLHRRGVLRAVQALERTTAGVRVERGQRVDARLERGRQLVEHGGVGPLRARGRHHAGAQLADHLLGDVDVRLGLRGVVAGQRHAARLAAFAMARRAVLPDQGRLLGGGHAGGRRDRVRRRRLRRGGAGGRHRGGLRARWSGRRSRRGRRTNRRALGDESGTADCSGQTRQQDLSHAHIMGPMRVGCR